MSWLGPNTALIFEEADVSDIVISILDAPMVSDRRPGGGGGQAYLAGVKGGLTGVRPISGLGVLVKSEARHPDGGRDDAIPVGTEAVFNVEYFDPAVFLSAMTVAVGGFVRVGRVVGVTDCFNVGEQGWLIGFDLGEEEIPGIFGGLKCFFDSAWRLR